MRDLRQDELNHISGGGHQHGRDQKDSGHKVSRHDKKDKSQRHAQNSDHKKNRSCG
jgi:hypothetical protein